jgi:tRNA modification GTPase
MRSKVQEDDTIFALSSAPGRAGIAVLRVSGNGAGQALESLAGVRPKPRQAQLAHLRDPDTGEALDRALVMWFEGPASYTGEDTAEFHVHGGRAVIAGVLDALTALDGVRPAEAGEFSRRAFENGKFDLTAVEGIADLINAETKAQRRQALRQSAGRLGALYEAWRTDLLAALARVEAALDFSDEADVPGEVDRQARPVVEQLVEAIGRHLDDRHGGERLREGYRVLIAGAPNAGKSSLLNALARREAAIVAEEAGTTRDVIEVHLDLGGLPITVMDTAGIRAAAGGVEREGIRRAFERAGDADLVIWLVDGSAPDWSPPDDLARQACMIVRNKIDLIEASDSADETIQHIDISVEKDIGINELGAEIETRAGASLGSTEAPQLTRARHRHELELCRAALERFLSEPFEALELRAEDLRQAAAALGRITGRMDVEDVLDLVFAEFCIGK